MASSWKSRIVYVDGDTAIAELHSVSTTECVASMETSSSTFALRAGVPVFAVSRFSPNDATWPKTLRRRGLATCTALTDFRRDVIADPQQTRFLAPGPHADARLSIRRSLAGRWS